MLTVGQLGVKGCPLPSESASFAKQRYKVLYLWINKTKKEEIIMSSGIALHFEKHRADGGNINGLQRHNERKPGGRHGNKNIRDEDTDKNILLYADDRKLNQRIDDRLELGYTGKKKIRKDAVKMVEASVQISGEITNQPEDVQEQYMRFAFKWLKSKFGEDNVVSAAIHKDETTMHLHFDFVPLTEDGRLSAKTILTKGKLHEMQDDLLRESQKFAPDLDFKRGESPTRGLSQKDFERVKKLEDEQKELTKQAEYRIEMAKQREQAADKALKQLDENRALVADGLNLANDRVAEANEYYQNKVQSADNYEKSINSRLNEKARIVGVKEREANEKSSRLNTKKADLDAREQQINERESQIAIKVANNQIKERTLNDRETKLNNREKAFEEKQSKFDDFLTRFENIVDRVKSLPVEFSQRFKQVVDKPEYIPITRHNYEKLEDELNADDLLSGLNQLSQDQNKGPQL